MTQRAAATARRPARPGRPGVTAPGLAPGRPAGLTRAAGRPAPRRHRIQILPGAASPRILRVARRVAGLAGASDASHYWPAAGRGGLAHAGVILALTLLTTSVASAAIAAGRPARRRRPRFSHLAAGGLLGICLAGQGMAKFLLAGYARAGRYRSCLRASYARDPVTTVLKPMQH